MADLNKKLADLGDPLAAMLLPDSRTKDSSSPRRRREVFCANCAKKCMLLVGSWVEAENVFYVCDACDAKNGPIPGALRLD